MTIALPELPPRIARLPKDERGYPVPAFVEWMKERDFEGQRHRGQRGEPGATPDFRFARPDFRVRAFKTGLCWICGDKLGVHQVFVIGPMCVINRTTMEPASHRDCAEFAAKACPFLVKLRMRRLPMGDEPRHVAGTMFERNPGCVCLYETREAKAFDPGNGWLIRLGKPTRVDWWAEGRRATRAEIIASIDSGYPLLAEQALKNGGGASEELARLTFAALKLLPAA
jgi:hypothetical protein